MYVLNTHKLYVERDSSGGCFSFNSLYYKYNCRKGKFTVTMEQTFSD